MLISVLCIPPFAMYSFAQETVPSGGTVFSKQDENWLVQDYETAIRVYNMYGIEAEPEESNPEVSEPEESKPAQGETSESTDDQNDGSTGTIIAFAACVVGAAICAIAVAKRKKK